MVEAAGVWMPLRSVYLAGAARAAGHAQMPEAVKRMLAELEPVPALPLSA